MLLLKLFLKKLFLYENSALQFQRKPQSVENLSNWKCVELRQFLLYIGPAVLFEFLPDENYKNFLILHVSTRIFSDTAVQLNNEIINYVKELFEIFITNSM